MKRMIATLLTIPVLIGAVWATQAVALKDGVDLPSPGVVSNIPLDYTPTVPGDWGGPNQEFQVTSFAPNPDNGLMYASGLFTEVKNAAGTSFTRDSLFAFNPNTGAISNFNAGNINGFVWSVIYYGGSLYIAGDFTSVNGVPSGHVAKLNPTTGAVDTAFVANVNGRVTDMDISYNSLVLAGKFSTVNGAARTGLANVDLATGAVGTKVKPNITGNYGWLVEKTDQYEECSTGIYRIARNVTNTKMVAAGCFTAVDGKARQELVVFDMPTSGLVVANWRAYETRPDKYNGEYMCQGAANVAPIEDLDFDPAGRYFYGVSSGGGRGRLCDHAFKYDTNSATTNLLQQVEWKRGTQTPPTPYDGQPGWDTLRSVEAASDTIYVAGHQRYIRNAADEPIIRQGIGALTNGTGGLRSWDPGHDREIGSRELFFTTSTDYPGFPTGLWVGSDSGGCGKNVGITRDTQGICFFPMP